MRGVDFAEMLRESVEAKINRQLSVVMPAIHEVQARRPPSKAQVILSTEPEERGSVASSGHSGGTCGSC
jgi:hypothetical protein